MPACTSTCLAPSGTFVPKTLDTDFLLLAAGSGITPMMAILKSALSEGSGKVALIYANRDEKSVIFAAALRDLAAKYPDRLTVVHWLETVQGLPSAVALGGLVGHYAGKEAFICGPGPFMAAAEEALRTAGTPSAQVHIEVFKSLESDPFAAVVIEDGRQRRRSGHRGRDARRRNPRDQLAPQRQASRRVARQGPRRSLLLS